MPRMSPWTVAAICATVAFGFVHALTLWGKDIFRRCIDEDLGPLGRRFQGD